MEEKKAAISYDHPLVRGMEKTIQDYGMIGDKASVLVGVSGGADSVALLHGLLALASIYGWRVGVAHVNHGLRGQSSDRDARFVETLANRLNLSYYDEKLDLHAVCRREGVNLEEGGRIARYAFYHKIADRLGFDRIAVGHHREDAAEQVLINLLRGSGPTGLGGLAPARGLVIRPLIETSRREIEGFLHDYSLMHCTDETNQDSRFTRNRIRTRLIPELKQYNPRIIDTLNRSARVLREESEWIEYLLEPVFQRAKIRHDRANCVLELSAEALLKLPAAARRRIVRKAISEVKGNLRRISYRHIENVLSIMDTPAGNRQVHLPGQVRVMRSQDRVCLAREKKSLRSSARSGRHVRTISFAHTIDRIPKAGTSIRIDEINARMVFERLGCQGMERRFINGGRQSGWMDLDRVAFPLTVRSARPGDRFTPLGMRGSMKIKDFFINHKVPPPVRLRVPLVESGGRIIWVGGMRIAEEVKITDTTRSVLKITLFQNLTDQQLPEEATIERV